MSINFYPKDIYGAIFSYLNNPVDLIQLARVCWQMHEMINSTEWRVFKNRINLFKQLQQDIFSGNTHTDREYTDRFSKLRNLIGDDRLSYLLVTNVDKILQNNQLRALFKNLALDSKIIDTAQGIGITQSQHGEKIAKRTIAEVAKSDLEKALKLLQLVPNSHTACLKALKCDLPRKQVVYLAAKAFFQGDEGFGKFLEVLADDALEQTLHWVENNPKEALRYYGIRFIFMLMMTYVAFGP